MEACACPGDRDAKRRVRKKEPRHLAPIGVDEMAAAFIKVSQPPSGKLSEMRCTTIWNMTRSRSSLA